MKTRSRFLAKLMCAAVLHSSIVVPLQALAQAATQVSANAASGNTKVYTAPTGVTVVDINTANAAGVSHNKYDQFNVGTKGLVLNNGNTTQLMRNSQLAGQVFSNFNLGNEATLILNEVVSPNRSLLAGYIEVLGGRADVVVANPYGITCSGCGFINTPRATLATGTPNFGADGSLAGFNVNRGDVLINGAGVEARNQAVFDVLARSVLLDGQINAQDMRIITGSNQINYASRTATPIAAASGEAVPVFSLDSTALGGMYANRIRLIATEAGVGVRMLGEVAASGDDFNLDAAGKLQLQNRISAKRDVAINSNAAAGSGGIEISGANASLAAGRDLTLSAGANAISLQEANLKADGQLSLSGQSLLDQSSSNATRFASGDLNLNLTGAASINGSVWGSGGAWQANLGSLSIGSAGAGLYSGANAQAANRSMVLNSNGNLALGNVNIVTPGNLQIGIGNTAATSGQLESGSNASITAGGNLALSFAGQANLAGKWQAAGNMTLAAPAIGAQALQIKNQAQLQAGANLAIGSPVARVSFANAGTLLANSLQIDALDWQNSGRVQAANGLQISADQGNNLASGVVLGTGSGQNVRLAGNQWQNAGSIQSAGALTLQSAGVLNNSGSISSASAADGGSAGTVTLRAGVLGNTGVLASGGALSASSDTGISNSGTLQALGALDVAVGANFENQGSNAKVQSGADLTLHAATAGASVRNDGRMQAAGALNLGSGAQPLSGMQNGAAAVVLGDSLNLYTAGLTNDGVLQGTQGVQIAASANLNNGAAASILSTVAGKNVSLSAANLNNAGLLQSTGALQVAVRDVLDNSGTLATIAAANGGSDGSLGLSASGVNNSGKLIAAGSAQVSATAMGGAVKNSGSVQVAGDLAVATATTLENTGVDSSIVAGGNLTLAGATAQQAEVSVNNDGRLQAGKILTLGNAATTVHSLVNNASGTVLGDSLSFTGTQIDNAGVLQGSNGVQIQAAGAVNNTAGASLLTTGAGKTLAIDAASLTNAGLLQSTGAMRTTLGGAFSNSGTVLTKAASAGGSGGSLTTQASSIANTGLWASGGEGSLTSTAGSIGNSGTLQAVDNLTLNTGANIANNGAGSKILSTGSMVLTSSQPAFNISNDGQIKAARALTLGESGHVVGSLANSASGQMVADRLSLTGNALSNLGLLQGGARLDLALTNTINNSGTLLVNTAGGVLNFSADTFANSGTVQSNGQLIGNTQHAMSNSGTLFSTRAAEGGSDGQVILSASAIGNSGAIGAGGTATISSTSGNIVNSGLIQTQGDAILAAALGVDNSGSSSVISGAANVTLTGSNAGFTLNNQGHIQAGQALSIGSNAHPATSTVNSAGAMLLGDTVSLTGGSLNNAGTVQGNNGVGITTSGALVNTGNVLSVVAGADISLSPGSMNNSGGIQSAGDLTVQSAGAVVNSGSLVTQDGAGSLSVQAGGITNSGMLQAANSASLTTTAGALDNTGTLQSSGSFSANVATAFNNSAAGAKVISGAGLGITSGNAAFTVANSGTVQAGGALNLGSAGHLASITNQSGAKLAGNSLLAFADTIDNSGRIQALSGSTVTASSLSNHGASAVYLGSTDSSASSLTLSGALTNEGAMHGSGNFSINAASISNSDTAGISSLANLNLTTSGNISNAGALYAGSQLNVTSGATFTNSATLAAPQGTLDSGGSISVNANTFVNNSSINATGNITISAATLRNETPGGDTRQYQRTFTGGDNLDRTDECYLAGFCSANRQLTDHYSSNWSNTQVFTGGTPAFKPQIISSGTLTLQNFNIGTNVGGVLSAPVVTLTGNGGGASFTNNDLSLNRQDFRRTWEIYTEYIAAGPLTYHDHELRNDTGGVLQSTTQVSSLGAGVFATTLNASGFGLTNAGSPFAANPNATSASSSGATSGGSAGSISAGGAVGGGNLTRANGAGAVSVANPNGSSGAASVAVGAAGKNNGVGGVAATNVIRLPGLAGGTILINLPTNPNGFFVTSKDPDSRFLVQANPLFEVGANTVGSDYLAQRLGFNTNTVEKRLGDANYEAYLVRQQLIAQTGSNIIKGYHNEAAQMQALMDQAASQSAALGLQFGQAPTEQQLAGLTRDIVWMVETEVAGQKVLAPVVYLAQSTRDGVISGAVIAANDINFEGDSLTNTGGSIVASNNLNVKTVGDIKNSSGNISGANVNLKSTSGSILNETVVQTDGDTFHAATSIGKTGTISASKNLTLDAAKDISIIGAQVKAGGNASLNAGGNVTLDTIENRTSSQSYEKSGNLGGSSTTTTQTGRTTNIGSGLSTGGNLSVNAGKAVTLAGSSIDTKGNLDLQAKDGINVLARQDSVTTNTVSKTSGLGVGGGLWGSQKTTKDEFEGKNVASSIKVGGDANLKTDGTLVLQGSDLKVAGSANLDAADIQVLAGKDEKRSTTVTETVAILTGLTASSKAGTEVKTDAGADAKSRTAGASASAEATASANAEVKLFSVKKETTDTLDIKNRGSVIQVGKDLTLKAKNDVTLQGADVQAAGNIGVDAKNINLLTAVDVSQTNTSSEETSLKLSTANNASAKASAGAEANGVKLSAKAQADARVKAATDNVIGVTDVKTNAMDLSKTNRGSVLKAGGDLSLKAKDTLTLQGSSVDAGGNVNLQAKDIKTLAAQDTKLSVSNTETTVAGIYIAAEGQAGANAQASANVTGVGASVGADANAEVGVGLHVSHETVKDVSGSSTAVVSSIKSGGNLTRTADNKITDVGTQIAVGGNLNQSAKEIESLAAQNTAFSTSESDKHTVRVGVFGEAGASAKAEAKAGVGGAKAGANAEAHGIVGFKVGYNGEYSNDASNSTSAVVSNIAVGGNLNSTSSGKTTLEATNILTRGDTNINASSVDFKAVQDTASSSSNTRNIEISAKVGGGVAASAGTEGGAKVGPQAEASFGFNLDMAHQQDASSTAVTGSLNSGGKINIKTTQGDIRLQGVDVAAAKDVQLKSAGNVVLDAAQSSTSSSNNSLNVGLQAGAKAGGGENSFNVAANLGLENGSGRTNTGKAGSIQSGGSVAIDAAKDVTLEGTKVAADGDVGLNAGGNVNLAAIKNTSSAQSSKFGIGISVEASASGGSGSLELDVALKNQNKLDSQAVSIQSGGKTAVKAAGDINQDGQVLAANQTSAGGKVTTSALQSVNQESDIRFGISLDVEAEKKKKKDATGKEIEEPAKPKDKLNQMLDKLAGVDQPAKAKPQQVADAGDAATPAKKPLPADPANPAKPPVADNAAGSGGFSDADRIKQRQADAEIAHYKKQGQDVDPVEVYKKWGLPSPDKVAAAKRPVLSDSEKAANAAKIPPFDKNNPRVQPTEDQARNAGWKDSAGKWVYPGDDGFKGKPVAKTLEVGSVIDRFGGEGGSFFAPVGTPLNQRAMAPGADQVKLTKYEILKPLPVESGEIAPWFDQPGGGTQYKLPKDPKTNKLLTAQDMIDQGYIRAVEVIPPKESPKEPPKP